MPLAATRWWQPSNPNSTLPGVLFEDEEHGWVLELDGVFEGLELNARARPGKPTPLRLPDNIPVLVGTTNQGEMVSLVHCQPLAASLAFAGSRGSLKLWPRTLIYGVHFENAEDQLTSLSVRYSHLDTWVGTSGFTVNFDLTGYPSEIKYSKPPSIESQLSEDLKLSVDFSIFGPSLVPPITTVQITQQSWLALYSTVGLPLCQHD